jgi:hypothetical protein
MQIQLVKLITGDEIISEVEDKNNLVVLKNPVKLAMEPNSGQITLVPYPMVCDKGIKLTISIENIVFKVDVGAELNNGYKTVFGHIVEPSKSLIV